MTLYHIALQIQSLQRPLKEAGVVKQRVLELASELGTVVEPSKRGRVALEWP